MQSNHWVTGGTLGSKDAVLVFRTSVLAAAAAPSHAFELETYSDSGTPSTSSSSTKLSSKTSNENLAIAPLPASASTHRINNENFNFVEKKSKKRYLESSSSSASTSSSSSLSSNNSIVETPEITDIADPATAAKKVEDEKQENKENIVAEPPIDKAEMPAALFNITYKFISTETRLLRKILNGHGMNEVTHDSTDYNLLWTGNQLKPDLLKNLSPFQRINHFPRYDPIIVYCRRH